MESTRIRILLKTIAQESATLRLLSHDTERLKKQFGLSETEMEALRSVDLLRASELSGRRSPAFPSVQLPGPQANGTHTVNMYDGLMTIHNANGAHTVNIYAAMLPTLQATVIGTPAAVSYLTPQGAQIVNMYDDLQNLAFPQLASNGSHPHIHPAEDPLPE